MSNLIGITQTHSPNNIGVDGVVPYSLITNKLPSAIPSSHTLRSVQASNGSTSFPQTMIQFQIPNLAYLKRNSLLFRFNIASTTNPGGTAVSWSFNNATNSAQAVIKNIRVLLGNTVVENIINYGTYSTIHQAHATNKDHLTSTLNIMEGAMMDGSGITNTNVPTNLAPQGYSAFAFLAPYEFVCQLQIGLTNNTVPLWLLNQPLTIQIDTAPVNEVCVSLQGAPSAPIASYTITNATLLYETVDIPSEVKNEIVQHMRETGEMYSMECDTVLATNTSTTIGEGLNYNFAVNLGSVDSVIYTTIPISTFTAPQFGIQSWKKLQYAEANVADASPKKQCLIDGMLVNNYSISTPAQIYTEFRRCLSQYNINVSSIGALQNRISNTTTNSYLARFFAGGFNLRKDLGSETTLTGSKVNIVQLNFEPSTTATNIAVNYFIYVLFNQKIMIDSQGNVMVAK